MDREKDYIFRCSCCSQRIGAGARAKSYEVEGRKVFGVFECPTCGAVQGTCSLGDSYGVILPRWADRDVEETVYFDLTTLGSDGIGRRHGWFDPISREITQVG